MPETPFVQPRTPTDTRERILAVAEELFADKGFPSTGIDEIARQVGIVKSVIYYHFRNKKAILEAIVDRFIEETVALKRQFTGQTENLLSGSSIDAHIRLMIQYMESRVNVLRILAREAMQSRSGGSALLRFWDQNVSVARSLLSQVAPHLTKGQIDRYFTEMYFLGFLPVVLFFVFADDWCAHYQVEREQAHRVFAGAVKSFVEDYMVPRISKSKG